jgi:hypothetical protein
VGSRHCDAVGGVHTDVDVSIQIFGSVIVITLHEEKVPVFIH